MGTPTASRRGVLAAAGTALLAGCSGLGGVSDGGDKTVRAAELPDPTREDGATPVVVETIPVDVERTLLRSRVRRVTELLDGIPVPFGPREVPNGHVRERLLGAAADATSGVEDARAARSRFVALRQLREARSQARYVAAGWAFAEGEKTAEDLRSQDRETVGDAESFRERHEYLGTDPVRAALVHARVERSLDVALADDRPPRGDDGKLLTVAEWGEHVESDRGYLDDGQYLYDRYASSLPADAGSVAETLSAAAEAVGSDLRVRQEDLPPEPTEEDETWRLRYRLHDDAEDAVRRIERASGPAKAVLAAVEGLTAFLAYDRVRERIEDGDGFGVEDAAGVREARSGAIEAIRAALDESPRPALARPVLADAATTVAFADQDFARYRGEVRLRRLDDPLRRYATATARARSVPAACRRVLDELGV